MDTRDIWLDANGINGSVAANKASPWCRSKLNLSLLLFPHSTLHGLQMFSYNFKCRTLWKLAEDVFWATHQNQSPPGFDEVKSIRQEGHTIKYVLSWKSFHNKYYCSWGVECNNSTPQSDSQSPDGQCINWEIPPAIISVSGENIVINAGTIPVHSVEPLLRDLYYYYSPCIEGL